MLRIAIVTRHLMTGGVEKALVAMLKKFDYQKISVDLYVEKLGGAMAESVPAEVSIYKLESPNVKSSIRYPITAMKKLIAVLKLKNDKNDYLTQNYLSCKMLLPLKREYDVAIAYHAPNTVPVFYVIDKISAQKKVLWLHGDLETNGSNSELAIQYYKKYDQVFSVSESVYNSFLLSCPEMKDKAHIFYNFTDVEGMWIKGKNGPSFEDGFDGTRILTVGRLVQQKGIDLAIDVCGELKERGFNVRWYVCGDGELRSELEEKIRRTHLENDFILLGNQSNPYGYMMDCDLYVQPSRFEGYCTTTNEARALCKPVITTDVSGAREQFIDGETGWIVQLEKLAILNQVCWCLKHQTEMEKVCENLRKDIESNKSKESSDQMLTLLLS